LFFYKCDRGWNIREKLEALGCRNKLEKFRLKPGVEYVAKIRIDAFTANSQSACFRFTLPGEAQATVLDFSPIHFADLVMWPYHFLCELL
ncbi:MAG: hypothetical protein AAF329_24255, partial [Cyanobacteria bacterium P01_A01_bin.17]